MLSFFWTPYDPLQMALADRLQAPSLQHWLGTDQFGRDLFSQIMVGLRHSVQLAGLAVLIGIMGGAMGAFLALRYPVWRWVVTSVNDCLFAFPILITLTLLTAAFGHKAIHVALAIGLWKITIFTRVFLNQGQVLWRSSYCQAARALGQRPITITIWHIVPNMMDVITVAMVTQFASALLAEAGLSYIGLGIPPPTPSLGRLLEEAQRFVFTHLYLGIIPGVVIVLLVLNVYALGKWLQHYFEK